MNEIKNKYNLKSPAVKRLMREAAELSEPTDQYFAQPLEDNLFEWHFTIRGPPDTDFDGGRYHGKITLPPEYPMKPPSIILFTPNGRFELGKKICLSMSAHHPETWQPSWSIRTVLLALIGFMPTKGEGALGALDYTPDERKELAIRSTNWKCTSCDMDNGTCLLPPDPEHEKEEMDEARELAAQISFKGETAKTKSPKTSAEASTASQPEEPPVQQTDTPSTPSVTPSPVSNAPAPAQPEGLRQRVNAAPTTVITQPTTVVQQRSFLQKSADYLSLGLIWIITAMLLFLVIRRLAMEKTMPGAQK